MKKTCAFILTFLLILLSLFSGAQQKQIDSLNDLIKNDQIDTVKAGHLYQLAEN